MSNPKTKKEIILIFISGAVLTIWNELGVYYSSKHYSVVYLGSFFSILYTINYLLGSLVKSKNIKEHFSNKMFNLIGIILLTIFGIFYFIVVLNRY